MIVAGFELTTIVLKPSARTTLSAWQPAWPNSRACPITIGPEPIRQIDSMSRRLGKAAPLLDPRFEDPPGVVRPGPGLGMELHRARPLAAQLEPLDSAVVERD